MKKIPLLSVTAALFASVAMAEDLKLRDGRTLEDYRITAEAAETVTVSHTGGVAQIEKRLLPPVVLEAFPIQEEQPPTAEEKAAEDAKRLATEVRRLRALGHSTAMALRYAKENLGLSGAAELAEMERAAQQEAARVAQAQKAAAAAQEPRTETEIAEAVRRRAERYFKTQRTNGSGASLIFRVNTELGEIRPIPGWSGYYEVTGEAWYQYYDSVWGGSFSRVNSAFTARVRTVGRKIEILEFDPR